MNVKKSATFRGGKILKTNLREKDLKKKKKKKKQISTLSSPLLPLPLKRARKQPGSNKSAKKGNQEAPSRSCVSGGAQREKEMAERRGRFAHAGNKMVSISR